MKRLILIDFSWLYNRYYYVASYNVSMNPEGLDLETTLERMLLQFLTLVSKSYPATRILLALDPATSSLKNKAIFEGYKQNRDKECGRIWSHNTVSGYCICYHSRQCSQKTPCKNGRKRTPEAPRYMLTISPGRTATTLKRKETKNSFSDW